MKPNTICVNGIIYTKAELQAMSAAVYAAFVETCEACEATIPTPPTIFVGPPAPLSAKAKQEKAA